MQQIMTNAPKELFANLTKYTSGQIDEAEFDIINALAMVKDIRNMQYKPYPTRPEVLKKYYVDLEKINDWAKRARLKEITFKNQEIIRFQLDYSSIESKNYGNYYWLKWCKKILGEDYYSEINPFIEEYKLKDPFIKTMILNANRKEKN